MRCGCSLIQGEASCKCCVVVWSQWNVLGQCLSIGQQSRTVLYKGEEDIRGIGMLLDGQPVDWDSPTGVKLAKLLSPSAQSTNFRIAHEVEHLKNYDLLPSILMPPVVLIFGYHFATLFSKCIVINCCIISINYLFALQSPFPNDTVQPPSRFSSL